MTTTTIMAIMRIGTDMDNAALYRLMTWLSPSYPVGAFSYSHGLEWEIEQGKVCDAESLIGWLDDILSFGGGRNDAILFACAHRAASAGDDDALREVAEHAAAFSPSAERKMETMQQGRAFRDVTCRTWTCPTLRRLGDGPLAYPVAVAAAAADHGIGPVPALTAYMHAFATNLVSAGVRLVPLGHSDGQRITMRIEESVARTVETGMAARLSSLSGAAFMADIASMKHETQYTRLFRS